MEARKQDKSTLVEIGNVRIRRNDPYNLAVERYESVYNPIKKTETDRWAFKGYVGTIADGLNYIVTKDLLIDENLIESLADYLEMHRRSVKLILSEINMLKEREYAQSNRT